MEPILSKICRQRQQIIQEKGFNFGYNLPHTREVPLCPPDKDSPLFICEIKRGSPSEGRMKEIADPVALAKTYLSSGANAISILTEENFFYCYQVQ